MAQPFDNQGDLGSRFLGAFVESSSVPGQVGLVVLNPDKTNIGGGGAGGATAANQTNGAQKTQIVDGGGNVIGSTGNALDVNIKTPATLPISAAALPLPTGASTAALQTTGNNSLSSIDGKLATLGQKTMAGSEPVVIASDQSPVPISGTVTATLPASTPASLVQSAALEKSHVIKASAGTLLEVQGRIDSTAATATYYLQLIDSAAVPADGAVTFIKAPEKISFTTGVDYLFGLNWEGNDEKSGLPVTTNGIVIVISTTEFTKTIVASNILSMTARFL